MAGHTGIVRRSVRPANGAAGRIILSVVSPPMRGPMPRPEEAVKDAFRDLVPPAEGVVVKPMFGQLAAFVNGNMFTGIFGEKLYVRVGGAERDELMQAGGGDFAPMPGRPMNGYVTLPDGWRDDPQDAARWIEIALAATAAMPPKVPKSRKKN